MFDFNALPVPPEFVDVLQETAVNTAVAALKKIQAPQEVIECVESIYNLGYYIVESHRAPETLTGDRADRYDIEEIVITALNAIAKCGGEFRGPTGASNPREFVMPAKAKK